MGKNRSYSSNEKEKLVRAYEASDLSLSDYSRKAGVASSTLSGWLKKGSKLSENAKRNTKPSSEFLELKESSWYEIQIGEISLRVPTTVSTEHLSKLCKQLSC